jgi:hypothetical protein
MKKLSIGFHPYEKRKNPLTMKTQIVMRVIVDGIKREVRLPDVYDLTDVELQKWNRSIQRVETKISDVNDYLSNIMARRKNLDLELLTKEISLTPTEIVEKLLGQKAVKKEVTAYEYTKRFLKEDVENSFKADGTKINYRNAINQFCIFLELKGWKELPLTMFKFEHANAFKKFLETPYEKLESIGINIKECIKLYTDNQVFDKLNKIKVKKQNCEVSSSTKIKNIRPVFEKAMSEDLIFKNPFIKIKLCFSGVNEASTLSPVMIKRIYDLKNLSEGVAYTKDLFIFMCFTGLSYADAIAFNDSDFEIVNGNIHLLAKMKRIKTGCQIRQVLSDEAAKIVFKYYQKGFNSDSSKVFPSESLESLNRKLKIIQTISAIPFELTTKVGRITFKNSIRESNIQNPFLTKKLMGWKKKSIEDIYDRFTLKDFIDAKNTFDLYIEQTLS